MAPNHGISPETNKQPKYLSTFQGFGSNEDDELKYLELESKHFYNKICFEFFLAQLRTQIIQKNKIINELNGKILDLTKKIGVLEEKLNMNENELFNYKTRTPSVLDETDSVDSFIMKKRKLDDYVKIS